MFPAKTPIQFAALSGITSLAFIGLVAVSNANPFGKPGFFINALTAVYTFYGIWYMRKYEGAKAFTFLYVLKNSLIISVLGLTLVYVSVLISGSFGVFDSAVQLHQADLIADLSRNSDQISKEIGSDAYLNLRQEITNISIFDILMDEYMKKVFVGILISIIASVYFRS